MWNREFCAATSTAVWYFSSVNSKFSTTNPKYWTPTVSFSATTMCFKASRPVAVAKGIDLFISWRALREASLASVTLSDSSLIERHCSFLESAISLRRRFFSSTLDFNSSNIFAFCWRSLRFVSISLASLAKDLRKPDSLSRLLFNNSSFSALAAWSSLTWVWRCASRSFLVRNCLPRPCLAYRASICFLASSRSLDIRAIVPLASS